MKLNLKKLGEQAIVNTTKSINMRLSENATSMVFQLFTKNVYSNPIGTVVREITSNCFDSHIEAKVNSPVIVRLSEEKETETKYISFIDYGVGMSPDRIENVYGVYFESTKRVDNTQIGGFGIGGKTPLAYKRSTGNGEGEYDNSFYVITIYDNTKYYYCVYEGESSPVISLLHTEKTKERNGTEVKIPVLTKDIEKFINEMIRQLYYFENVIFEGFEDERNGEKLMADYQIIRSKSFLFRGSDYSSNVHICLGRVAYPIDFQALDLIATDYCLPMALRLEVGDINVTVSRESIDYSEETIKMLKKKLEVAKAEIFALLATQYGDIKTLDEYFDIKNNFGTLYFKNGASMYVGNLIKQKDVDFSNFTYNVLNMPSDMQLFRFFFTVKSYGKKPSKRRWEDDYEFKGSYKTLHEANNLLYVNGDFKRKVIKQSYLKSQHSLYHIITVKDISEYYLVEINEIFGNDSTEIFNDNGNPTKFGRKLIKMQKEYLGIVQANAEDYDTLVVPEYFIEERKNNRKMITTEMRKQTIPIRFVNGYGRDRIKLDDLFNYNMPIFWGTADDEDTLKDACTVYNTLFGEGNIVTSHSDYNKYYTRNSNGNKNNIKNNSIMFIQLAKNNIKYMEYCKNAMHINMFACEMAYRKEHLVREYYQYKDMLNEFSEIDPIYLNPAFARISFAWADTALKIQNHINDIPERVKNNNISCYINAIKRFIPIDVNAITQTKKQKVIQSDLDDIKLLQSANNDILEYINLPYYFLNAKEDLFKLLRKVMVL